MHVLWSRKLPTKHGVAFMLCLSGFVLFFDFWGDLLLCLPRRYLPTKSWRGELPMVVLFWHLLVGWGGGVHELRPRHLLRAGRVGVCELLGRHLYRDLGRGSMHFVCYGDLHRRDGCGRL